MAIGEDRPIHLRHDVVDFHAFQSLRLCHVINVCHRSEVEGTRNVVLESARRQISHQGGTRHNVHGYAAEFMWLRTTSVRHPYFPYRLRACRSCSSVTLWRQLFSRTFPAPTFPLCGATCVEKHLEQGECCKPVVPHTLDMLQLPSCSPSPSPRGKQQRCNIVQSAKCVPSTSMSLWIIWIPLSENRGHEVVHVFGVEGCLHAGQVGH